MHVRPGPATTTIATAAIDEVVGRVLSLAPPLLRGLAQCRPLAPVYGDDDRRRLSLANSVVIPSYL